MSSRTLLLTGVPGSGKTTVLRRLAERLGRTPRGFLTDEVREGGERTGFRVTTFDGRVATLARVGLSSKHTVGRYGVDVGALDAVLDCLEPARGAVFLVDEIGKMECLSPRFVEAMRSLLDADVTLVATIAQKGSGFIAEVKKRPGVELWTVTRGNRDALPDRVAGWLAA